MTKSIKLLFFSTSQGTSRVPTCNVKDLLPPSSVILSLIRVNQDTSKFLLSRAYDPQKVLALR
jgi:hypothetical protein